MDHGRYLDNPDTARTVGKMNEDEFATESEPPRPRSSPSDYYFMFFLAAGGIVIILFIYGAVHASYSGYRKRQLDAESQQWVYLGPLEANPSDHTSAQDSVATQPPEHGSSAWDLVVGRARSPGWSSSPHSTFSHTIQRPGTSPASHGPAAETMRAQDLDSLSPVVLFSDLSQDKLECINPGKPRKFSSSWRLAPFTHETSKLDSKHRIHCDVCVVCLDSLREQDTVRQLPCEHVFHSKCLLVWVTKWKAICPLCKVSLCPAHKPPRQSLVSRMLKSAGLADHRPRVRG